MAAQGASYQMHLETSVGPSAPLLRRRASSYGRSLPRASAPALRGRNPRGPGLAPAVECALPGRPGAAGQWQQRALLPGAQDQASQFVQLTWLFLTQRLRPEPGFRRGPAPGAGRSSTPGAMWCWARRMWRLMGLLPTWHLKPQREVGGGDLTAEVWLAPSVQFCPCACCCGRMPTPGSSSRSRARRCRQRQNQPHHSPGSRHDLRMHPHRHVRRRPRRTGVITLNRPKALNALNDQLMDELGDGVARPRG